MKHQFICGHYNYDGTIQIYLRGEDTIKRSKKVTGFRPYFFVPQDTEIIEDERIVEVQGGLLGLSQDLKDIVTLKKITVDNPLTTKEIRSNYKETWEAKIPIIKRFMIDTNIKAGLTCPDDYEIHWTEIEPCDFTCLPTYGIIDIETNSDEELPDPEKPVHEIGCITVFDSETNRYMTVLYHPTIKKQQQEWKNDHWLVIRVTSEEILLQMTNKLLEKLEPDKISGWHVKDFDIAYLVARAKKLGVKINLRGSVVFDLITPYRTIRGGSFGNRLKDIAVEEGFAKADELVADSYRNELWTNPDLHETLIKYNRDDDKYCKQIIEKYDVVNFFWGLKNNSGTEDSNATSFTQLIDTLLLRLSNIALPTVIDRKPAKKGTLFVGGEVIPPIIGIHKNVAYFDFSMQYPWHLVKYNFSPELMHMPDEERIKWPKGLVPRLSLYLMNQRKEKDKYLDWCFKTYGANHSKTHVAELQRNTTKFLLNAVYGHLCYYRCRIFDPVTMGKMVAKARECLLYLKKRIEYHGYQVIGGDTDGLPVKIPRNEVDTLLEKIHKDLMDYASHHGIDEPFEVKLDWYADKMFFIRKKDSEKAAKKKYSCHLIEKDGKPCDTIINKGFELIRSDQSNVTRDLQKELILAIYSNDLDTYAEQVRETIERIKNDKLPLDDIAITINLGSDLDKYKSNTEYARGSKYSNEHFKTKIGKDDRIKMLFVKRIPGYPKTDVVCYLDVETLPKGIIINKDKIIDRTIKGKIINFLEITDWTWDRIIGKKTIAEAFG